MLAGLVKNAALVALLAVALAASTKVDAAGLTYPKCPEGGEGCCAFGSGKMKNPGYAVVHIEVDTIITCHQGDLKCFAGNPNLRAGGEGRDEIDCPDFSALEESRSEIEYLDGVKTSTTSTTTTTSNEGPGAVHPGSLRQ